MIKAFSYLFSLGILGFLTFIFCKLTWDSVYPFSNFHLFDFGYWDFRTESFKALSMFYGSFVVSFISLIISIPIGIGAAIFLSEYLTGAKRAVSKVLIELLAGIPSVVYGLLGVVFLSPWIRPTVMFFGGNSGDSLLTAGILLAIMVLPTVVTFSDDALRCVSRKVREGSLGLGMSKSQTILYVVLPQAKKGIVGAIMLALGRAIGETIAIYMVIGRSDKPFSFNDFSINNIFESGQTITTKLGGTETFIGYGNQSHWQALMALGLCLWLMVGILSFVTSKIQGKYY